MGTAVPRERIEEAISEFNRYHAPEAIARLIEVGEGELELEMSGPYCRSCCLYDWFGDFAQELEERAGVEVEFAGYKAVPDDPEAYRVRYRIREPRAEAV